MPKQGDTAPGRGKALLSWEEFYGRHEGQILELLQGPHDGSVNHLTLQNLARPQVRAKLHLPQRSPLMLAADRLNELGVGPILRAADADNSPESLKTILQVVLIYLGVKAPKGVFTTKAREGKPGRPISTDSGKIYSTWIEIGRPSLFKGDLAQAFYRGEFTKGNGIVRKKLRHKCRHAVERYIERDINRLQKELAHARNETVHLRERLARVQQQLDGLGAQE